VVTCGVECLVRCGGAGTFVGSLPRIARKPNRDPIPKVLSQRLVQGKTVYAEFATLEFAYDQRSYAEKQQGGRFQPANCCNGSAARKA